MGAETDPSIDPTLAIDQALKDLREAFLPRFRSAASEQALRDAVRRAVPPPQQ